MKSKSESFEDLDTIRNIMEKSTRFLSLSGLSGIFAGSIAIAGAAVAFFLIFKGNFKHEYYTGLTDEMIKQIQTRLIIDALVILLSAIGISFFFSYRKSIRQGLKIWTPASKRFIVSMLVPLVTGGITILILFSQDQVQMIVPAMLIFYGLALVNAANFTYNEVFYLGLMEIFLGFISGIFPEFGIYFWSIGFGVLHIAYGFMMYRKYEK